MKKSASIVALHGAGMNEKIFAGLALPGLISVTLPGHDSAGGACLAIADAARHVLAGLPEMGDVVLMGHSMGAMIALCAAADPRVKAVVVLSAAALMPVNAELLRLAAENPAEAQAMMVKWGVAKDHPQADVLRARVRDIFAAVPAPALALDLAFCDAERGVLDIAPHIDKPVLVLAGDQDKMVKPEQAHALADLLPQGRFQGVPGAGHMLPLEQPQAVADAVRQFLS
jgi:pimeloyl-ACP methyl ester carboxylesterase